MNIAPLHNRVLIEKIEEPSKIGSIFVPEAAKDKPTRGKVVAVGPGIRTTAGDLLPMGVKVGDEVLFGKFAGAELRVDGKPIFICLESDIIGVFA